MKDINTIKCPNCDETIDHVHFKSYTPYLIGKTNFIYAYQEDEDGYFICPKCDKEVDEAEVFNN